MNTTDQHSIRVKTYKSGAKPDRGYKLADKVFAEDAETMSRDGWTIQSLTGSNLTGITVTYIREVPTRVADRTP